MNRYRYIIISCILALMNIGAQAQLPDSVYCYFTTITKTVKRNNYSTTGLLMYNSSNDTIVIEGFRKLVHYGSNFEQNNRRADSYWGRGWDLDYERRGFYWKYLTLSNEEPEDDNVIISGATHFEIVMRKKNGKIRKRKTISIPISELTKEETIVIPPHSLFVSDVYMRTLGIYPRFPKGYYKKVLYYDKKIIAEMIERH